MYLYDFTGTIVDFFLLLLFQSNSLFLNFITSKIFLSVPPGGAKQGMCVWRCVSAAAIYADKGSGMQKTDIDPVYLC